MGRYRGLFAALEVNDIVDAVRPGDYRFLFFAAPATNGGFLQPPVSKIPISRLSWTSAGSEVKGAVRNMDNTCSSVRDIRNMKQRCLRHDDEAGVFFWPLAITRVRSYHDEAGGTNASISCQEKMEFHAFPGAPGWTPFFACGVRLSFLSALKSPRDARPGVGAQGDALIGALLCGTAQDSGTGFKVCFQFLPPNIAILRVALIGFAVLRDKLAETDSRSLTRSSCQQRKQRLQAPSDKVVESANPRLEWALGHLDSSQLATFCAPGKETRDGGLFCRNTGCADTFRWQGFTCTQMHM